MEREPILFGAPRWLCAAQDTGTLKFVSDTEGRIKTLEGVMVLSVGDYIIHGVNGELYPCKPDIFEKTYERTE